MQIPQGSLESVYRRRNPPSFATRTDERLTHITITCNDVLDVLQVLKLGKASGLGHISHHIMLKYTASTVCKPLQKLYTFSLRLAAFPDNWKTALVLPLFKNGEKQLPANYRPIVLLSTVGKVFERVVFKNLFNFFFSNNLFYKFQSGFTPGHSTLHQLIEIFHNICITLEEKNIFVYCSVI